jgi:hypothetical protein
LSIAIFAGKSFEVNSDMINTFNELQYGSSIQTEKQDSDKGKPSTYIKGSDLDTMSYNIQLDKSFGVEPRSEMEQWVDIMNDKRPYPFILGGRPMGGNWLLVSVEADNIKVDSTGDILTMDLSLKFDEHVRDGSPQNDKESPPAVKTSELDKIMAIPDGDLYGPDVTAKRENPNFDGALRINSGSR